MPPIKGQMFRYSEEDMEAAIKDVERGLPVATSAKKHKVPRITLLYKVRGKSPRKRKMGRDSYLSKEQEEMLVTWVIGVGKAGFPVTKDQLLNSVKKLVTELKIQTPFTDGRPGKRWYESFLKRHPELTTRVSQNLTSTRASVTKQQLDKWFQEVLLYLKENNYDKILDNPSRIFNADETAFFLNPKGNKVLATKGDKTVYQQVNSDEKECLTVLFTGNAAGDIVHPMVIFKYERIPRELCLSVPASWGLGRSENGWMTGETFYEFISNIFNTWLNENKIPKPVILFIDGHTSHLTLHVSKFCSQNGIILVALYPNATHLIQPMDVAVFRSLKGAWKNAVHQWRIDNIDSPILKKTHFCPLLKKVIDETLKPSILLNGFRKCGLFPWNPDAVCNGENIPKLKCIEKKKLLNELEASVYFIEKYIDKDKIASFQNSPHNEWSGNPEDKSLYEFYQKITYLLNNTRSETSNNQDDIQDLSETLTTTESNIPLQSSENDQQLNPEHVTPVKNAASTSNVIIPSPAASTSNVIIPNPATSTSNVIIPSPFKRALFWPEPKQTVKKRKREKIPAVVTSLDWQKYYEDKEKKKATIIEVKKIKAEERKKKKELNEQIRKQKNQSKQNTTQKKRKIQKNFNYSDTSSDNEVWVESGDSIDDIDSDREDNENDEEQIGKTSKNFKEGDFLLINFPGKKKYYKYVCIVQKVFNNDIEVMAMVNIDDKKTTFRQNETDVSSIKYTQIIEILPMPNLIRTGDRIKYQFSKAIDVDG